MRRRQSRSNLTTWCIDALDDEGFKPALHHRFLISKLEAVARGQIKRLMVLMPPGSAKSTYTSVLFPPWFLAQAPNLSVLAASHTTTLAESFSRKVQRKILAHSNLLGMSLSSLSADLWSVSNGGQYKAAGVGSAIAGFRADLGIIDDPVKSREAVESDRGRDKAWEWYLSDYLTRLKPNARQVFIVTRWHEDDLAGRVLLHHGAGWDVVKIPAIAGPDDPLGRVPGDPLWSDDEYGYAADLEIKRTQLGSRDWASLYQQNPTADDGGVFKVGNIGCVEAAPAGTIWVRAWDLAATKETGLNDPSKTVGLLLGRAPSGRFIVGDIVRFTGGPDDVERIIIATAQRDGRTISISAPQDPGQAGKAQAAYLAKRLVGFKAMFTPETGDKATRAAAFASQVNVGNVDMVEAPWNREYVDELRSFPGAAHDDQVDASSRAFHYLTEGASVFDKWRAMAS